MKFYNTQNNTLFRKKKVLKVLLSERETSSLELGEEREK